MNTRKRYYQLDFNYQEKLFENKKNFRQGYAILFSLVFLHFHVCLLEIHPWNHESWFQPKRFPWNPESWFQPIHFLETMSHGFTLESFLETISHGFTLDIFPKRILLKKISLKPWLKVTALKFFLKPLVMVSPENFPQSHEIWIHP